MQISSILKGSVNIEVRFDASELTPNDINKISSLVLSNLTLLIEFENIDGREFLRRLAEKHEYSVDEFQLIEHLFDKATPRKRFIVEFTFPSADGEIKQTVEMFSQHESHLIDDMLTKSSLLATSAKVLGATSFRGRMGVIKYHHTYDEQVNEQAM